MFPKQFASSDRKLRMHWSATKLEEFDFDNGLESFLDASHGTEKSLRSSHGIDMQTFLGTICSFKFYLLFLPTNSSDAELQILHKAMLRVKQYHLLLTSFGIPNSKPTKACEENESMVHSIQ